MIDPSLKPPSANIFMVASSSNVITIFTFDLLPSMDENFVSRYDFGAVVTGLPSLSQKIPIDSPREPKADKKANALK